jgi:TatA/E family protein of Tat protein translocase
VFALILDSLGSTELLFILVIALIFFGPRKLPELARSMGKGLAEFRKASDDFKRTWEREVELESARTETQQNSIAGSDSDPVYNSPPSASYPVVEPASSELVVPREATYEPTTPSAATQEVPADTTNHQPLRKQDWL